MFSSILYGCARILKGSFSNCSKSSIARKYERNRYKFKFPEAPASATRAQPLSSGAMHDRIYGPICGSIHHHGIQNSGGGRRRRPPPRLSRGGLQDAGPSSLACSASFLPGNGGKIHAGCIPISTAGSDSAAHVTYSRRRGMQEPRMALMRHDAYYSNRSTIAAYKIRFW